MSQSSQQKSSPAKATRPSGRSSRSGMTLLEMTVVILVLLSLITVLFFGAQAWKRGSDRALCIINLQNVQKGMRSYANLYGYSEGANAPNLQTQVIGLGRFIEATPTCPGSGTYSFGTTYGTDTIPPLGTLYMQCSLSGAQQHEPTNHPDW